LVADVLLSPDFVLEGIRLGGVGTPRRVLPLPGQDVPPVRAELLLVHHHGRPLRRGAVHRHTGGSRGGRGAVGSGRRLLRSAGAGGRHLRRVQRLLQLAQAFFDVLVGDLDFRSRDLVDLGDEHLEDFIRLLPRSIALHFGVGGLAGRLRLVRCLFLRVLRNVRVFVILGIVIGLGILGIIRIFLGVPALGIVGVVARLLLALGIVLVTGVGGGGIRGTVRGGFAPRLLLLERLHGKPFPDEVGDAHP
jgi:hypothetical protein